MSDNASNKTSEKVPEKSADTSNQYWQANLRLMYVLLAIWFFVSFVCGILIVDYLDQFRFFGFKLGFWFAQQGAIYVFVALIFVYARQMKILDRQFDVGDDDSNQEPQS